MTDEILEALVETGLLQFGLFKGVPFKLNLAMLPSYPDVLKLLRDEAIGQLEQVEFDHLVCTYDGFALGLALSLELDKPLVWCREEAKSAASDLVGAYDFGHPAVLIVNVFDDSQSVDHLIQMAGRVGLEIGTVLAIVDYQRACSDYYALLSLLGLLEGIQQLSNKDLIPTGQAEAAKRWLSG